MPPLWYHSNSYRRVTVVVRLFVGCVAEAAVGQVRGEAGEGEDILVHALDREEVFAELDAGRIDNGHTLVALLWFRVHWQRIREAWRTDKDNIQRRIGKFGKHGIIDVGKCILPTQACRSSIRLH